MDAALIPGASRSSRRRSSAETAIVRLARRQASASRARSFRHSTSSSGRIHGRRSRAASRCQIWYSTLCSKRTTGAEPSIGTFIEAKRKSATTRSTPASVIACTCARTSGTCHFHRSTGYFDSHERNSAPGNAALPRFGTTYGSEITRSQYERCRASPSGSSPTPCVVITATWWRRDNSEIVCRLRTRPPVVDGHRPPIFTQRIRITFPAEPGPALVAFDDDGPIVEAHEAPRPFEHESMRQAARVVDGPDSRWRRQSLSIGQQQRHDAPGQSHGERVDQHRCRAEACEFGCNPPANGCRLT